MSLESELNEFYRKRKKEEEEKRKQIALSQPFYNSADIAPVGGNSNIAPVWESKNEGKTEKKESEDRTYFKAGAFEDGYQFGDVLRTVGASATDLQASVVGGLLDIGEGFVDAGATLVAGVGGIFSDDFQEDVEGFIEKDLYEGREVAKYIVGGLNPGTLFPDSEYADFFPDPDEDSIFGEKSRGAMASLGQLIGQIGLTAATGGAIPWWVTAGVTSFGSEVENALNQDATLGEAATSGLISAGAEILTEKISGGIKFGGKALDDALTKQLATKISNKFVRNGLKIGMDMAGEGAEEWLSEDISRFGQWLTYQDDKTLEELLYSEEAMDAKIESFIGGAFLGGAGSGVRGVNSVVTGRDATSGLTANEEKVFNHEYEKRIAEEAEAKGEKLTSKEKNKIYDETMQDLQKGRIDIDTIESVLGGESYKTYKNILDSENSLREQKEKLQAEFDALQKMKQGDMTGEQMDRRTELREQLAQLDAEIKQSENDYRLDAWKEKLSTNVQGMLTRQVGKRTQSDNFLLESYAEKGRRSEAFKADTTKYKGAQAEVVQKAIDSGVLNNTRRTHEFVDLISKISADKGVLFDFTNNQKLKESGFAVDGANVNGFVTKDGITLNMDSHKAWQSTVGHEITHVLEGTELYTELQNAIKAYAESKGEYQSRYDSITALYKDVEGANVDAELTADLVGEYLFTDEAFVQNLSAKNRNVFQKIYDELKYLLKVATAGSKEARELEKVKRAFDKAYKAGGNASEGTKYSISDKNIKDVSTGFASGESYYTMTYTQDGKVVGTLEYGEYDGEPNVKMIEVEPEYRRKGIATKLMQELQKKYPDAEIDFGMSTPDGTKLLDAITYDVTDEAVVAEKQKLKTLQTELDGLQGKLDALFELIDNGKELTEAQDTELHELGDRWQEVYETIRDLEKSVRGKRATKTYVKTDTKYSLSDNAEGKKYLDKYTQKQYNSFGWARDAEAVTQNELDDMYSKIHEKGSLKKFPQTSHGEAIIEVNDNPHTTLGTDNVFIFVTGSNNNPQINKVVRFQVETDTEMEIIKEKLYERGSFSDTYYSYIREEGFAREYSKKSSLDYNEYAQKVRRGSGRADSNRADRNSGVKRNRRWTFEETESNDIAPVKASSTDGVFFDGNKPKYSLSDSDGKALTKEQGEYFKDSKMRDENGNLKVMYHGSQDAGFHVFDPAHSDDEISLFFVDRNDVAASYSGTTETYEAQSIRTAEDMNRFIESIGAEGYEVVENDGKYTLLYEGDRVADSNTAKGIYEEFCWYEGVGEGDANYKVYLNLTNPLEIDAKGRPWNKIDAEFSQEVYDKFMSLTAEEKAALVDLAEWEDFHLFNSEIQEARNNELASAYAKLGEDSNIYDIFSVAADNFSEESLRENSRKYLKTRDYAARAKEQGYDGVIFKNIHDNGGYSNGDEGASTVAIAFDSNQVKSVANEKPTKNADIRFSLSKPVEETPDLIAAHNLSTNNLLKSLELGGLPMPSVAITRADSVHNDYGDVSVILRKDAIDPKANRENKIYSGDAWTPVYPTIEFKPNDAVTRKIGEKYYELERKYGHEDVRPLYRFANDTEDALKRDKGEQGMLNALYEDTGMMQVYLLDKGLGKVETIQDEIRTELSDVEIAQHEFFIKELGADVVDGVMHNGEGNFAMHRKQYWENHGEQIKETYKKLLTEEYGFTEEEVQNVFNGMKTFDYLKLVRDAHLYRKNGRVTVKTEPNIEATKNAIREKAADGYKEWVDGLFKGIEEKTGIRNNRDYFTPSGNRRSWDALHWENTLENVVRVMKEQGNGENTFFTGHGIWGAAANEYKSIEEVKADSDRLKRLPKEEYEAIRGEIGTRLQDVAARIMDKNERNQFIAADNALACIVDAVRNSRTAGGVLRELKQYSQLTVTEADAKEIVSIVSDIAKMPTEYFEAKPRRAVGFDEVGVFVIPRNADSKLKQELLNRGYAIAEYDPDVEGDRQKVVNSFEEYKFSLSDASAKPERNRGYATPLSDLRLQEDIAPVADAAPVEDIAPEESVTEKPIITGDYAPQADPTLYDLENERAELERAAQEAYAAEDTAALDEIAPRYNEVVEKIRQMEKDDAEMQSELLNSLDDADAPPETEAPYYGEESQIDPFADRDVKDVRHHKAYMYENPEVKPFFQAEANVLLGEWQRAEKPQTIYNGDLKYDMNYDAAKDIPDLYRVSRNVSEGIATLRDDYNMSYEDIKKGLDAIIEDNGAENIAAAKKIEFLINDRLLNGYNAEGVPVPANVDYKNLVKEKAIFEYSEEARAKLFENGDAYAPMAEAPKKASKSAENVEGESSGIYETPRTGQMSMFKEADNTEKPIKTVKDRLQHKLNSAYGELSHNKKLRRESLKSFDGKIANLEMEYAAKKNKDTKVANDILRRIERYKRLREDVDADYTKRINDNRARVESAKAKLDEGYSEEEGRTMRSELHARKVDEIKNAFSENGLDFDDTLKNAKDLSTFKTVDNTPQRVMEKSLGYKGGQVLADLTVNKVAQNETEGIKWLNSITSRHGEGGLLKQLSKKYHIKPGSKESAAAQMYAEGFYVDENSKKIKYGDEELAKDFPNAETQKNIKGLASDPRIRQFYDDTLAQINESRTRNAYPEIKPLDNYFLHFRAMDDTFSRMGIPFNPNDIKAKDLPTDLNGVTADLKPGQPYFASAMHRRGNKTTYDLLGGIERYATGAKNQIYHIDDIQTLRALRNYIADTYGQANGLENLDNLSEEETQDRIKQVYNAHLSTFAKFLNEEANVIAGKTALIDRGLEGIIGRRGIQFLDTVNKQVGSNMVGGNVSSAGTNFLPIVQAFAKTNKTAFVKGFAQTVANKVGHVFGKADSFADNPTAIRRKGADRFYRTPWQKAADAGYALMGAVDNISTEVIVRAKYNEFIEKGMSEQQAITEADKWASRLMGDRSLGQMPQLYNSKMLGMITKFQLEVRNQLDSQFYDTIQETKATNEDIENAQKRNAKTAAKVAATFAQLAIAQHIFGKVFESIAGYNPAFDIIDVLIKALGFDDEEESEDTALDNVEQGFLALLEDLPYTSTFTGGRIPISSALPVKELVTGKDDYGNEKSRLETLGEIAPYYALPTGYGQLKKTVQGLSMFSGDHPVSGSYTDSGNLRFPVEDTPANRIQAGIFGQWASENARYYFDNDIAPLKEKQIQEFADVDMPIKDYWKYRKGLSEYNTISEKADYINSLDLTIEQKNILINNIADRKEPIDMSNYTDFNSYEEFDFAIKNPEKYSFFKENGISYETYAAADEDGKRAYTWAYENPGGLAVAKAVTGDIVTYRKYASELYDIKADKDASGKSITGSRKEKVIDYVNNLDIDYGARLIIFKSEYNADDTYNYDIIDYLNSREDISYEDMVSILKELGFTVDSKGNIYW